MLSVSTSSFSADRDDSRTLVEQTREEAQEAARIAEADRVAAAREEAQEAARIAEADRIAAAREEAQTDSKEIPGDTYTPVEAIVIVHPDYIPSDSSILDEGIWLQSEGKEGIWLQQEGLGAIWLQKEGERGFSLQTKGTEIPGDTYIPGDSSNLERESQKLALDVGPVNANEISSSEKDFIHNFQKAYKIKLLFDENSLANIKKNIASEWEGAKQAIAQMSGSESATMYSGYANLKPALKLDDQVLRDWGVDLGKDFKELHSLNDEGLAKQIEKIAAVQKIWADYYAKVADIEAFYQTLYGAIMANMASLSQQVQDNYDTAIEPLKLARDEAILVAEDEYKSDLAEAEAIMTQEFEDAEKKYHEDLAAANNAEEEEAAMTTYLASQAAIQEKYAMAVASAKVSRDEKIALAWELFLSEVKLYAPPSVKQIMTLLEPYFDALKDFRTQLLLKAEQERDEALAALES